MLDNSVDAVYFSEDFRHGGAKKLCLKLKGYGVHDKVLSWIKVFLTDRRQKVLGSQSQSDWANVTSGIPEGNVQGPLLFTIFINDLPDCVKSALKIFTDDTKIYMLT